MKKSEKKGLTYLILIIVIFNIISNYPVQVFSIIFGILVIMFIYYMIQESIERKKQKQILDSGIYEIDKMGGLEFEKYLELLLYELGFKIIERTPGSGDYGADLIIKNNEGMKIAVQAKRYKSKVNLKAVQEVNAAIPYYDCQKGMVITNNYLTNSAKKLANVNNIDYWERELLIQKLLDIKKET